jgi:tetratricopeptide (TPR) repeat protein
VFDYGRTPQRVAEQGWRGTFSWLAPLLVMAVLIVLRKRARTLIAAALVSLLALLPVLGLLPFNFQVYSTVADHYLYFAMLGPALAAAWLLARRPHPSAFFIAAILLLYLAVRTFEQTPYWRNSLALFEQTRQLNPASFASYEGLASLASDAGEYPSAIQLATVALQINPRYVPAYITRSSALAELRKLDAALADCRKALDLAPQHPQALANYAALLASQGRYLDAIPYARRAVEGDGQSVSARLNLASLYVAIGDAPHARPHLDWVLKRDPDNALARSLLSQLGPPPPPPAASSP